jgi:hypothetical protein
MHPSDSFGLCFVRVIAAGPGGDCTGVNKSSGFADHCWRKDSPGSYSSAQG